MFDWLARVINRLPWAVVVAAILFASLAGIFGGGVSKSLQSGGFQDPSSQSSAGVNRLENASGLRADGGIVALVRIDQGIDSSAAQSEWRQSPRSSRPSVTSTMYRRTTRHTTLRCFRETATARWSVHRGRRSATRRL